MPILPESPLATGGAASSGIERDPSGGPVVPTTPVVGQNVDLPEIAPPHTPRMALDLRPFDPEQESEPRSPFRSRSPKAKPPRRPGHTADPDLRPFVPDLESPSLSTSGIAYAEHIARGFQRNHPQPCFQFSEDSLEPEEIKWEDSVFSLELDVSREDVYKIMEYTTEESQNFISVLLADAKRKTEVSLKHMTPSYRIQMDKAKKFEVYSWINNNVFVVAKKSGVPFKRIMSMRWVLTWKADPRKAKARLVVRGYTDPDLTSLRAESPTLSKVGRHIMLQLCASNKWTPEVGDVNTAFLQGEHGEDERNVYAEPDGSTKPLFGLKPDEVLKLTGSVYGLRTAPKAWFQKVA